jgi:hypothetical protein
VVVGEAAQMNLRRLAAVDMHGARGTRRRRRVILAGFALGGSAAACSGCGR